MPNKKLSIAIVGAGMGGLAVAATLRRVGFDVQVYEQASALRAHRRRHPDDAELDEGAARHRHRGAAARRPRSRRYSHLNRDRDTGEVTRELPMPESLYGAPYLCMHRADLHDALASVRAAATSSISARSSPASTRRAGRVTLAFADGTNAHGGCRDRRRRRALDRARHHRRPGRRRSTAAASPIARCFRRR